MTLYQLVVIVSFCLALIFFVTGLWMTLFGERVDAEGGQGRRIRLNIGEGGVDIPDKANLVLLVTGAVVLLATFDLMKSGGMPAEYGVFSLVSVAYAQEPNNIVPGWVYFGTSEPASRNFEILAGNLDRPTGAVLRGLRDVNIREDHFSNLTGSFLGKFAGPEPRVIGLLPAGHCARVNRTTTVGFGRIWVEIEPVDCPTSS